MKKLLCKKSLDSHHIRSYVKLFTIEENAATLNELERFSVRESEGSPLIDQLIDLTYTNIGKVLPKSKMG
jgi:hypothetical protein